MAPFIRIALRWIGGALVATGWLLPEDRELFLDPELISAISYLLAAACATVAEGWYYLERRWGWE